jgi:alpha-tubulin suppressor-like RCC1 family protein
MVHGEAIRRAFVALALAVTSATCYAPFTADGESCSITCAAEGDPCPGDLVCNPTSNLCGETATTCDEIGPVPVKGEIGAGYEHACAIDADGALFCWGSNALGQLSGGVGVAGQLAVRAPVAMQPGGVTGGAWHGLSVGTYHACALRSQEGVRDELWCWGNNGMGQVTEDAASEGAGEIAFEDDAPWVQVAAGGDFTCALNETGRIYCWGGNRFGQSGIGAPDEEIRNGVRPGPELAAEQLVAGEHFACALETGGTVSCWGDSRRQQAGGEPDDCFGEDCVLSAASITTGVARLAAGGDTVCALYADGGGVRCWGSGESRIHGRPGDENDSAQPLDVEGTDGQTYVDLDLQGGRACAARSDGTVECWGGTDNDFGQRGLGAQYTDAARAPLPQVVPDLAALKVSVGTDFACALGSLGGAEPTVHCWGRNYYGQVGDGTSSLHGEPLELPAPPDRDDVGAAGRWLQVAAGGDTTCGVYGDLANIGTHFVHCWGRNGNGQATAPAMTPTTDQVTPGPAIEVDVNGVPNRLSQVKALVVGSSHACAIGRADAIIDKVYCWGDNSAGQLSGAGVAPKAIEVAGQGNAIELVTGGSQTCARGAVTDWSCWGTGSFDGQVAPAVRRTPTGQPDLGRNALAIGAGYVCVFRDDPSDAGTVPDHLACRGSNELAELGNDDDGGYYQNFEQSLDIDDFNAFARTSSSTMCVSSFFDLSGGTTCWGDNGWGQAGVEVTEATTLVRHPTQLSNVAGLGEAIALAGGRNHMCAIGEETISGVPLGPLFCWGYNGQGQLGLELAAGDSTNVPERVFPGDVRAVAAGDAHTCAIDPDGKLLCWGSNEFGAMGTTATSRLSPTPVAF